MSVASLAAALADKAGHKIHLRNAGVWMIMPLTCKKDSLTASVGRLGRSSGQPWPRLTGGLTALSGSMTALTGHTWPAWPPEWPSVSAVSVAVTAPVRVPERGPAGAQGRAAPFCCPSAKRRGESPFFMSPYLL
ncbi:hypothetical protein GCM10012287_02840 [Streptomyces daqingensis]|uniref:Uncharacterized protein n=1 Tax=Streptomyces daqingensis TaxID=1472640 RepID=A0ABQ2LRI3_9ACTN|nr:hypothetical protein GCM10012287_02840 [Streptomyces daqingensis]